MLARHAHINIDHLIPGTFIVVDDVQVQNSASQCRISWQLAQNSFIPAAFTIHRKIGAGSWTLIESAYSMPSPFTGYKFTGINRNFYYVDSGLTTAGTYQYRINNTFLSNTITKTGTTYYVSTTDGNDSYNGLYPTYQGGSNGPWLTINEAINSAQTTGDLVLFNKGNIFPDNAGATSRRYLYGDGTINNPITWASYGSGNLPVLQTKANDTYTQHFHGFTLSGKKYHNFEFLEIEGTHDASGSGGKDGNASVIMLQCAGDSGPDCEGHKILNCELDLSGMATDHPGGGIFMYNLDYTLHDQDANEAMTYHVRDIEVAYCYLHDCTQRSALRAHGCREYGWYHNNFFDYNSAAWTIYGGTNHVSEYNEAKGGTYSNHNGPGDGSSAGSKALSQQFWNDGVIYRYNLIYYMNEYNLSIQDAKDSLVEFNTLYNNNAGYGTLFYWSDPDNGGEAHWAEGGNICKNNISMGSTSAQGAVRINIADLEEGGGNWYDHVDFYDNCFYETVGSIIELDSPDSKINTHALFLSNWNDKYPDDIHEDPQFNSVSTGDFTTNNSNCSNKGCFAT